MKEMRNDMPDREAIEELVRHVTAAVPEAEVHAVPDSSGLLVRVVAEAFASVGEAERKQWVDRGLPATAAARVHSWELLTPAEAQWYGDLSADAGRTPGWPLAFELAEGATPQDITFASDLDDDLASAPVVTFYSLKGGVGRSTALVAAARRLSSEHGLRVLCIDMDLEAPGLDTLFGIEGEVGSDQGVLSALLQYEFGDEPSVLQHVVPVDDAGRLYCMPAGRLDSTYAAQLRSLEPEIWYRERVNALHKLVDDVRTSNLRPDVVLIDSRTGMSPVAAPLLFDVSDMAVVCFHPHGQARPGTELLTKALLRSTTRRPARVALTPEPRFVVSPMPPGLSAARLAERAKSWVEGWLEPFGTARGEARALSAEEITHVVPYNADVAFSDTVATAGGELAPYARIADWIVQIVPEPAPEPALHRRTSAGKAAALRQLSFSTGTAELLDHEEFLQDYVVTRQVNETADPDVPLILGRKGTGKTALFRWLAAGGLAGWKPVCVATPNQFRERPDWSFGPENYAAIDAALNRNRLDWGAFWQVLATLAIYRTHGPAADLGAPHPAMEGIGPGDYAATRVIVDVLADPMGPLQCADWLRRADAQGDRLILLFDGLDTAFGHSPDHRRLRSAAISGLLTKQADLAPRLKNVRFKILVRQDIWHSLRFENKSHFYGLSRRLQWEEREEYFKVVLKRAVRAEAFREILGAVNDQLPETDVASWSPAQVAAAWGALVGERMRGERTAFTSNWVWNRLADGNGDHSPRSLLQLFAAALEWEREEEKRSGYDRSVLRPRSLALSLERVSEPALSALLDEEFQELRDVANALREYGRTPVGEDVLEEALGKTPEDLIGLAQEAGLIAVIDSDGAVRSFRVPDLYRWALSVTRRGPM
ncbi:ParA family protein [Streptomyces sp. DH12]|uniref:tyrosine-protein kinase family protein n=1 Tax=Streptomyces sp. DH12 TaxID=2857010 RepID=UPI001E2F05FD|nr:ParA family protein [Streptomyces sp. DH12]